MRADQVLTSPKELAHAELHPPTNERFPFLVRQISRTIRQSQFPRLAWYERGSEPVRPNPPWKADHEVKRWILIAVAVVVGLFVIVDVAGRFVAEAATAKALESSLHLSGQPRVTIGGIPFLTHLASGD